MLHGIPLDSDLDKEAALLAKMDHPNIVRLYGICRWDTQIALVMEMMNLGDLKNYVRQRQPLSNNYSQFPAPLLTTELINIAGQIAAGLCYLNSQQIVHRDLGMSSDITVNKKAYF
uniref:Protein kinase domain-containing protein n=1 Tax=Panagrolaimus superbus TaxID=310955 RepID=A0A914YFY9_9BILA